ncbi:hypothetical protein BKA69DRAFT_1120983 [Paraphysoderma sedebokerense]|nr:hypothetical protein BKA69DRAFT_1120983 [Paraphysoderma sedebokerense]
MTTTNQPEAQPTTTATTSLAETRLPSSTRYKRFRRLIYLCKSLLNQHREFAVAPLKRKDSGINTQAKKFSTSPTRKITSVELEGVEFYENEELLDVKIDPLRFTNDEELLDKFFEDEAVEDRSDQVFVQEVYYGCIRNRGVLEGILDLFYCHTGSTLLRSDYNFFMALLYLSVFRINDLSFSVYSEIIHALATNGNMFKVSEMISFIYDEEKLDSLILPELSKSFDGRYIQDEVLQAIKDNLESGRVLKMELSELSEQGMKTKKSNKPITAPQPFVLTKPKPRPVPKIKPIPLVAKSRPIPKSVRRAVPVETELLEKKKQENRAREKEKYEKAKQSQFKVAHKPALSDKTKKKLETIKERSHTNAGSIINKAKPVPSSIKEPVAVKLNTATILRDDALVRKKEEVKLKLLMEKEVILRDTTSFGQWQEEMRIKEEAEKKIELEKRRLEIQLTHEEALIAREEKLKQKREIVVEMQEEAEQLKTLIETEKRQEEEEKRKKVDEVQETAQRVIEAKTRILEENKKIAAQVAIESEKLRQQAKEAAEEEARRKAELIRQIKLLESIPVERSKHVDLTETSGFNILNEMSIVELQERLTLMKQQMAEEEEARRQHILKQKQEKEETLREKLKNLQRHRVTMEIKEKEKPRQSNLDDKVMQKMREQLMSGNIALKELSKKLEERKAGIL